MMSISELVNTCHRHLRFGPSWTVHSLVAAVPHIVRSLNALSVMNVPLPWGRYLLHHDPEDHYNIQLDVFSRNYAGSVHAHGTWGLFYVVRGTLLVWDYAASDSGLQLQRHAILPAGSAQCFSPPAADWHRVATLDSDVSTVSMHLYGPGFNMEEGITLGEDSRPKNYVRSAFLNRELAIAALSGR